MSARSTVIRIGSGAGFVDDRIAPAVELVEHGALDYLVFEDLLAERSIALATLERLGDPDRGYNEWLQDRMEAVLPQMVPPRASASSPTWVRRTRRARRWWWLRPRGDSDCQGSASPGSAATT